MASKQLCLLAAWLLMQCQSYISPVIDGFRSLPWNISWHDVPLVATGIPAALKGTLLHGSQGRWQKKKRPYWIDGYGSIHGFKFDGNGGVTYSMEYVRSAAYNTSAAKNESVTPLSESGPYTEVSEAIPVKEGSLPMSENLTVPTGIAYFNVSGHMISVTGLSQASEFDPDTLKGVSSRAFQWDDDLSGPYFCPTHMQQLPDGTILHHHVTIVPKIFGGMGPGYTVYQVRPGSTKREVIARIDNPNPENRPRWMHSPLVTKDYYVMLEVPCYYPATPFDPFANMDWKPEAGTYIRLVNRKTGEHSTWPVSRNVDFVHPVNAYQDGDTLVIDTQDYLALGEATLHNKGCNAQSHNMYLDNLVHDPHSWSNSTNISRPVRFELPLDKPGAVVEPRILNNSVTGWEFMTFWYDLLGKKHRYAYGLTFADPETSVWWDQIAKLDVKTGEVKTWSSPDCWPSEPIFVPAPGAAADAEGGQEDLGWILTTVLDSKKNHTKLLVLDASSLVEVGSAGPTPMNIPMFYHSRYMEQLQGPLKGNRPYHPGPVDHFV